VNYFIELSGARHDYSSFTLLRVVLRRMDIAQVIFTGFGYQVIL
jgi:hypothetical protein